MTTIKNAHVQTTQATQVMTVRKVKRDMPGVFLVKYQLPSGEKRRISVAPKDAENIGDAIRAAIAAEHVGSVVVAMDPGVGW